MAGGLIPETRGIEGIENLVVSSDTLSQPQQASLYQLLEFQCSCLERQLADLREKQRLLREKKPISVSLDELVNRELLSVAETALVSASEMAEEAISPRAEIANIIEQINLRAPKCERLDNGRNVRFIKPPGLEIESEPEFHRSSRRSTTLPSSGEGLPSTDEVQSLLHQQKNCKPCAFFYNKKKGCRNGASCGFCHHEDHSLCSLKQWKKQNKLATVNPLGVDSWGGSDSTLQRFTAKARFKARKPKATQPVDSRFQLDSDEEPEELIGPKIDPFGRPIAGYSREDLESSSESDDDIQPESEDSHLPELPGSEVTHSEEYSRRIAIIGCDWDNITPADLWMLCQTGAPQLTSRSDFVIKRVAIYLSDFGAERLKIEATSGPVLHLDKDKEDDEEEKQQAIRRYQQERTRFVLHLCMHCRYRFGVVEFVNEEHAKIVYDELDGVVVGFALEGLDLRFIPDSVEFPRGPESFIVEEPINYQPPVAFNSALGHTKTECDWDENPHRRRKALTGKFTQMSERDLENLGLDQYIASDSDSQDENGVDVKQLRSIIPTDNRSSMEHEEEKQEGNCGIQARVGNFQISFGPSSASKLECTEMENMQQARRLQKKKSRRDMHAKHVEDSQDSDSMDEREFKADELDPRFARVYRDPDFRLDITHPKYRVSLYFTF
ncbi:bifunctional NUC153/Pre-rRNA-processing protein Esf1/Zinc finger [Babesia duncani]|uniref:Bifunctional NUC153/Pre-rRNA-processing protein Esf1/Zinc finger n=1 Tax=Babesia duncani TaxID=323732 RepID=A0AAD9PK92_9APIC|nr:bifunctional NUC153/Pre-rRNA-processing protein Esf1/Zinc finger [Babesia duncani]